MRQMKLPHKLLKILEGESLLNDASALLVYRLAILAATSGHLTASDLAPVLLLTTLGSLAAGIVCARVLVPLSTRLREVPVQLIVQFSMAFVLWIAAEALGLSGILTLVAFAMTLARRGGMQMPARSRIPIFAVWESAVFVLNAFAFVLIGMQLRPIWQRLAAHGEQAGAIGMATAILATTIAARFAWVMMYTGLMRRRMKLRGHAESPAARPANSIVLAWAGMRGIVTLAAAFAIPEALPDGTPFPHRDLILLCAFAVVLGTLVLQGLTMAPLIRRVARDPPRPHRGLPRAAEVHRGR
jgi:CPA1 family monovalent cation:H+ antiporter